METDTLINLAAPLVSLIGIVVTAFAVNRPLKRIQSMKEAVDLRAVAPSELVDDIDTYLRVNATKLASVKWRSPIGVLGVVVSGAGAVIFLIAAFLGAATEIDPTAWLWWLAVGYMAIGIGMAYVSDWRVRRSEKRRVEAAASAESAVD
ncbi:hypothetical protein [Cellulomonas taurus]|uniref:hypothetical protein n=1 Tax=Cellulomonas taurus TaxID=2729175 RepID=UPI00145E6C21|nr:hypothetical protein [Cellulomonas taurus]